MQRFARLKASFKASIGDIVFGMEDGTVSIFGLVFGVALSAPDSKAVLLAGATGAAAAAVSMMAGTYLDAQSVLAQARAEARQPPAERAAEDAALAARIAARLAADGAAPAEVEAFSRKLAATPGAAAAIRAECAPAPLVGSPLAHALWMFAADIFAGAVPVLPFAFLPLEQARMACLAVTGLLLLALGVGRGLVARQNLLRTTIETMVIAAAAAAAGVLIGRLLS